jgi:non-specific serine/threonine protein kinase/serine/threonine-protein kinase
MEYVDGQPITDCCRERGASLAERLELFRAVCEAVRHAHQHLIIHRDIKPSNILIEAATGRAVVTDFGIAKLATGDGTLRAVTAGIGTLEYSAPEQLRGDRDLRPSVDVYSLGMVLFEMLNGRPYYDGWARTDILAELFKLHPEYEAVLPDSVPPRLRAIVACATARRRSERYERMEDLLTDLTEFAGTLQPAASVADGAVSLNASPLANLDGDPPMKPDSTRFVPDTGVPGQATPSRPTKSVR